MEKHNLVEDFPEYKTKIQDLKTSNDHFKKLSEEYDVVNRDIHRVESGAEVVSEEVRNDMHSKRVYLKDQLYALLKN
jgi:uncharacterized protein YdcH (DUF465 family)